MKLLNKFALLFFCLFLFIPVSQAEEGNGPTLWSLSDDDTTIYILGTIHLMNAGVDWKTSKIIKAFETSNTLILEVAPTELDEQSMAALLPRYGFLEGGQNLRKILSKETNEILFKTLRELEFPRNALDRFQPWMAASFLAVKVANTNGFLKEFGVETVLTDLAKAKNMPVLGLETAEFQLGIFSNLSLEIQTAYLEGTLAELDNLDAIFIGLRDAWLQGNLSGLDTQLNSDWEGFPEIMNAVLTTRNENWAIELEDLMDFPGQFFIAVGTGHLVGDNNLISLLEKAGFEVSKE